MNLSRVKMGTKAYHKLGDISRDEPGYFYYHAADGENYYGQWLTGYGYINVRFPKSETRDMTEEEREYLETHTIVYW